MPQHITNTIQLKCDKEISPTPLTVTSQSFMSIDGKLQATEDDKQPNTNIKSFGMCSVLRSSCKPSTIKWDNKYF
ncbi:PAAR-like protein [Chryseobacterium sp. JK1]|uniref:PAAR-like protein n=1 Tax=Chryseobacterium sp. JK1 TaxID=874294 RepID=UPI003D69765E